MGIFGVLNFGSHSLLFCILKGSICALEQINLGAWKMDFSRDHRCEVYCIGENSLAHPSTDMWFLSEVTRQQMACSECLPGLSGTLHFFLSSLLQPQLSLWSFFISSPQQRPENLTHWIIASVDQFVFPKLWSHWGTGQGCSSATHCVPCEGCFTFHVMF